MFIEYYCGICERRSESVHWLPRNYCLVCGRALNRFLYNGNNHEVEEFRSTAMNWLLYTSEEIENRVDYTIDEEEYTESRDMSPFRYYQINDNSRRSAQDLSTLYHYSPLVTRIGSSIRTISEDSLSLENDFDDTIFDPDRDSMEIDIQTGRWIVSQSEEENEEQSPSLSFTDSEILISDMLINNSQNENEFDRSMFSDRITNLMTRHHTTSDTIYEEDTQILRNNYIESILNSLKKTVLKPTDSDVNNECCICQDIFGTSLVIYQLPCQHKYHGTCITRWLDINAICPICRCIVRENNNDSREQQVDDSFNRPTLNYTNIINNLHAYTSNLTLPEDEIFSSEAVNRMLDTWFLHGLNDEMIHDEELSLSSSFMSLIRTLHSFDSEEDQYEAID
ncbi:uncharacterized protein BX663DRAFT_519149 [Cokeromyces recurvatus]|uniref:uncharacterized protein n=1 Tax=Cokeromyces recurvatus TaxID=90255 RepID=UPI00221FB14A|nr:uncharacterized protein BX663DRAFT_519149 [Cokeromyces recurvatus]KAI7899966.1 hypothetical protein BX663DRAFT_519149 [Cokeromyces recurvatus]